MKKINLFLSFAFLLTVLISCDVIEEPYRETIVVDTTLKETDKRILLEDYTGFKCTNCPEAAELVHRMQDIYGERLIVVAVHAGYYAKPKANSIYTYDFRTDAGDEYDNFFEISAVGNPMGMINRVGYKGAHIFTPESWTSELFKLKEAQADLYIDLSASNKAGENKIKADCKIKYFNDLSINQKIVLLVVEDSIVDSQTNKGVDQEDYVHNHVLRANFNGPWGDIVSAEAVKKDDIINKSFEVEIVNDEKHPWRLNKIKVIAFVYNADTYEILQSRQVKLKLE